MYVTDHFDTMGGARSVPADAHAEATTSFVEAHWIMMAPGFVPMANALSLPSNALLQVNSPWRMARVFPKRLLNSKSPVARQSLNTPRDFSHAKLDPTQHDTQDVRRHLRGPSKSPVDSNWIARIAHTRAHCSSVKVV